MSRLKGVRLPQVVLLIAVVGFAVVAALALGSVTSGIAGPASSASDPEISFVDGAPIQPNVRPVIVCAGSDYDMGYQYYAQIGQIWGTQAFQKLVRPPFSQTQINALKAYQNLMLQETPEMIDFIKGATAAANAAGIALSYEQVLAGFTGVKTFTGTEPPEALDDTLPPSCSGWAAWGSTTTDGRLIVGGSTDGDATIGNPNPAVMFYPKTGNNFIVGNAQFSNGRGVFHSCMNNKGVSLVHHGGNYMGNQGYGFGPFGYGVPPYFAAMHTLRFANDAIQAKDMQLAYTLTDRNNKGLWVDVNGNAFDIEAKDPLAIRQPGYMGEKDFIYASNNTMSRVLKQYQEPSPDMGLFYIPHAGYLGATYHYYDPDAVTRNLQMWNMLHNYHGKIDVNFGLMMFRFTGNPPAYSTLEEAEAAFNPTLGKGWTPVIGNLSNSLADVCVPDNGDNGLFFINQGGAARGGNPECEDYYYYYPDQTYTFYKLQLAATPADAATAAHSAAHYALYYADHVLRKLTYTDVGYAPLKEIFDDAAKQMIRGNYYMGKAGSASGSDAAILWGRALRGFAGCQALANEVYESLVLPPNDPSDLGLKKWFGAWGDWATRGYPWDSNNPHKVVAETIAPPQ